MKPAIILFFLWLLLPEVHGQISNEFKHKWDSIENWYGPRLQEINIIGNGIAFIKDGKVVMEKMYGFQDKDTRVPISINTIYNWASCTKLFTAIAIIQLRDQGEFDLSDTIDKYLPEIKTMQNKFNSETTIKQVLMHTSGLPRFSKTTVLVDGNFYESQSKEEYVEAWKNTELQFEPGTKYQYSNMGYDILGLLIERVTGQTYKDYIFQNILKKLGMNNSYFDQLPDHQKKYRSNNYRGHKKKLYSKAQDFDNVDNTGLDYPSGGLNAPFTDMILFMNFLSGTDTAANKVLKDSSLNEMLAPQKLIHGRNKNGDGHEHFKGMGFAIINPGTYRLVGHEGESSGFMSAIFVNPKANSGYLFAWNTTYRLPNKKDDKLFRKFNDTVYEELLPLLK